VKDRKAKPVCGKVGTGRYKERVRNGKRDGGTSTYKNRTVRPVETVLRKRDKGEDGGVNLT
jgi:hypothetical protein